MKFRIINGPNLNLLGIREPEIYGKETYGALIEMIRAHAEQNGDEAEFFQSNHEGDLVDFIQGALGNSDAIVINPGSYTHTSVAILDAVRAVMIPTVEVHISDPDKREPFRKISFIRAACAATVSGKGTDGYLEAMDILKRLAK